MLGHHVFALLSSDFRCLGHKELPKKSPKIDFGGRSCDMAAIAVYGATIAVAADLAAVAVYRP